MSLARLGSRSFPDLPACPHCGAPVRVANFLLGDQTEHYDPDASYRDSVWTYCRLSVATMPPDVGDTVKIMVNCEWRAAKVLRRRDGDLLDLHVEGLPDEAFRSVGQSDLGGWRLP